MPITKQIKSPWPNGWRDKTCVMGVINVTPDSFSDGGLCFSPLDALSRARTFVEQNVDVIDIGAQSTRPGADEIEVEEELNRLLPALSLIRDEFPDLLISIDTFSSIVASQSLNAGADWINDISGGYRDPNMYKIIAECDCPFVVMHSRGNSQTMQSLTNYDNLVNDIHQGLLRRTDKAISAGISPEYLIWDPGIGFAKTTEQNLLILKHIDQLVNDKFPVLIGVSRKRFIGEILNQPDPKNRIWGSLAVACKCALEKVSLLRTHDVNETVQLLTMANKIF